MLLVNTRIKKKRPIFINPLFLYMKEAFSNTFSVTDLVPHVSRCLPKPTPERVRQTVTDEWTTRLLLLLTFGLRSYKIKIKIKSIQCTKKKKKSETKDMIFFKKYKKRSSSPFASSTYVASSVGEAERPWPPM